MSKWCVFSGMPCRSGVKAVFNILPWYQYVLVVSGNYTPHHFDCGTCTPALREILWLSKWDKKGNCMKASRLSRCKCQLTTRLCAQAVYESTVPGSLLKDILHKTYLLKRLINYRIALQIFPQRVAPTLVVHKRFPSCEVVHQEKRFINTGP